MWLRNLTVLLDHYKRLSVKKAIKSLSFLWVGSLFGSGSAFIIYMILARELGPKDFGVFSSVLSMITVFSLLAGFGVSQVWLKLFGKEGWDAVRWIKPSLNFVIITLIVVTFLLIFWAIYGPHGEATKQLLLSMLFFIYGYISVELVSSKLQLEEKYSFLALWQLLPNLSRLILIVLLLYLFHISLSVSDIGIIYGLIGIFFTIFGVYQLYTMQNGKFYLKGHPISGTKNLSLVKMKDFFSETWPFGLGSLFAFIYIQSDIIMLKYISGDVEAGYYSTSFIILTAVYIFPSILYQKFLLPKFHRWANHDREKFHNVYKIGNLAMLILGILISIVIWNTSVFFIPLIFGEEYINSILLTKILALTLPFYLIAFSVASTLVTKEHMKKKVVYMGFVALFNIILNLILIPAYEAKGAAIATVISNALLLVIYYYAANKYVFSGTKRETIDDK